MKHARRMLGILLSLVLLLGTVSVGWSAAAAEAKTYKVGDVIRFGNFPQTEVTDASLRSKLYAVQKVWHSYDYYSGAGGTASWDDGKMKPSDYMQYADFIYQAKAGAPKEVYRAVQFSLYRPYYSGGVANPTSNNGTGFAQNTVYYYKYEPLEWIVLNPSAGLLLSKKVLDSQAYQNYVKKGSSTPANNYPTSSLHTYLNDSFFNTAFTAEQRNAISTVTYDCTPYNGSSKSVKAKVTVLSYNDCKTAAYGFQSTTNASASRMANDITDYARIQGISLTNGKADWWLRTANNGAAAQASFVGYTGNLSYAGTVNMNNKGVRPVITLSTLQENTELNLVTCPHTNTQVIARVEPTCAQPGKTESVVCLDCGGVITPSTEIPALDHVDKVRLDGEKGSDGWCDVCGKELSIHLDNSGKLQLSGPMKSLIDMIRNLILKLEEMFGKLNEKKPADTTSTDSANAGTDKTTNTNTNTNTNTTTAGTNGTTDKQPTQTQEAIGSFIDSLGNIINGFKNYSDQKSAEKAVDRNNSFEQLTNLLNSNTNTNSNN